MSVVIRHEVSPYVVELEITSDLSDANVNEFRAALYAELPLPHRQVRLDLHKVLTINSAALGVILFFQKQAREEGKEVSIGKCSDELRRTIMAIRLDRIISIEGEAPPTVSG